MRPNTDDIRKLETILSQSRSIAFLGGAGVSTESGLPDFRSGASVEKCVSDYGYTPQSILSSGFLENEPEIFFAYYRSFLQKERDAEPNAAHMALSALEKRGKLTALITQNIDELHERAGSRRVLKLHGSVGWNRCTKCAASYPAEFVLQKRGIPRCDRCGGMVRPEIVLYDEALDDYVFRNAKACMFSADTLLIAGSSLTVYPAASLPEFFMGKHLLIINESETPFDAEAELILHAPVAEVFSALAH